MVDNPHKLVMITTRMTAEQRRELQIRAHQAKTSLQQYVMGLLFPVEPLDDRQGLKEPAFGAYPSSRLPPEEIAH